MKHVREPLALAAAVLVLLAAPGLRAQSSEFNLSCNPDEVLAGISGRQGWWMDGIAARCRNVTARGALGATVRTTAYAGGGAGALETFDCAPDEVLVGYRGAQGDNGYVLHVHELTCAPWRPETRTAGAPARTVRAFAEKTAAGRAIGDACLEGRVGTRLRGRAGNYLDRLADIGCSYAGGAEPPTPEVATRSAAGAGPSRAQAIRPAVTPTMRPRVDASGVPAVSLASPRPLELKIGGGRRLVNLSGTHLERVTHAAVVTADGREAAGFEVAIAARQRSADRLPLSLIAGKAAAPGDYALRLTYELDDPRPQTGPRPSSGARPVLRTVVVPVGTLAIRARAMMPAITQVTPAPLKLGRDYSMIRTTVAELPGAEVVSVTRFPFSGRELRYCDFAGTYHSPDESVSTGWLGEHNLEIRLSPGRLIPRSSSGCVLRFSVTTRNELGEQFVSMPETRIEFQPADPDPRKAYRVNNTRELKPYVAFREEPYNVGVCSGTSPGTSGLIRVGVIDEANDIALRIRSGPIGTKCTWMVYPTGLRDGWELRMTFEEQRVGNKCSPGIETSAGGSFEFDRMAPLYFQGGVLTLSENNPRGEIPPYDMASAAKYFRYVHLACGPTLTNDHGVTLRMVSAELFGPGGPNCTWRCGVRD
ncbi:MAG TPA: hypothetical protein VF210_00605 [Pseudomonadales bacterium]